MGTGQTGRMRAGKLVRLDIRLHLAGQTDARGLAQVHLAQTGQHG